MGRKFISKLALKGLSIEPCPGMFFFVHVNKRGRINNVKRQKANLRAFLHQNKDAIIEDLEKRRIDAEMALPCFQTTIFMSEEEESVPIKEEEEEPVPIRKEFRKAKIFLPIPKIKTDEQRELEKELEKEFPYIPQIGRAHV